MSTEDKIIKIFGQHFNSTRWFEYQPIYKDKIELIPEGNNLRIKLIIPKENQKKFLKHIRKFK